MPQPILTRRAVLAATGLGAAAMLAGCDITATPTGNIAPTVTPRPSPLLAGPYTPRMLILGETPGTMALPQPESTPSSVKVAVYYPSSLHSTSPIHLSGGGPFPILLFAHAFRSINAPPSNNLLDRDFTELGTIMFHVASYGCVCLVPDLSWAPPPGSQNEFSSRASVLTACYKYLLDSLNATLFSNQLDLSHVVLAGHSTGGGGAVNAGPMLAGDSHIKSLSYGLVAPVEGSIFGSRNVRNLVVIGSSWDINQDADPMQAYTNSGTPKTLVMIPKASHFGYTDNLCPSDNSCSRTLVEDVDGGISRDAQQHTAAAYLASLVRYYALGDTTQIPYLTGQRIVEGLDTLGVNGIQVQSNGVTLRPSPGPNLP